MKKKLEKMFTSPVFTVTAFALAAVLLITSAVGGARAARTIESDTYAAQVEMQDIGVELLENGEPVAWRIHTASTVDNPTGKDANGRAYNHVEGVLLSKLDPSKFQPGVKYQEVLTFRNPASEENNISAIDEYIRVTVRKYWAETEIDEDGNAKLTNPIKKRRDLDPGLIELHFTGDSKWVEDTSADDPDGNPDNNEYRVFYYKDVLTPGGKATNPLTDYIMINGDIAHMVDQEIVSTTEDGYTVFTTTYAYNGLAFCVECEVDAVQNHNWQKAARSAWGNNWTDIG